MRLINLHASKLDNYIVLLVKFCETISVNARPLCYKLLTIILDLTLSRTIIIIVIVIAE